ncbi:dihydroxyacetone kinase subunit DhaL [Rhodobacter ferrooxidans]|uniref:Dihydroxyacetone kinase, L subunit n=1 Tax=Rhodobacter ferrooxidans TaxID=371731 RepID=C8RYK0_9RHOB|nr:dihydroxyacetone kinase subunit DhaL [Rhodobacter sp. SW2]EEW26188.1 dihydroxyacetone kinase, L subunit [Rhodobacter sp. SW2]
MSSIDSAFLIAVFRRAADRLEAERQALCALDGEIGDGDHGTSMANGFAAINDHLRGMARQEATPAAVLRDAASTFLAEVGATVGPLYATAFLHGARLLEAGDLDRQQIGRLVVAMADGIKARGQAELGDKTMIDVWYPAGHAAIAAAAEGGSPAEVARALRMAAEQARETTVTMIAARGRASRLKERSLGHLDPGGASAAIILAAIADTLASAA